MFKIASRLRTDIDIDLFPEGIIQQMRRCVVYAIDIISCYEGFSTTDDVSFSLKLGKHEAKNIISHCKEALEKEYPRLDRFEIGLDDDRINNKIKFREQVISLMTRQLRPLTRNFSPPPTFAALKGKLRQHYSEQCLIPERSNFNKVVVLDDLYVNATLSKDVLIVPPSARTASCQLTAVNESAFITSHIDPRFVTLVESPTGGGKTSFCKRMCSLQPSDDFLCVYISLRDLIDKGQIESLEALLTFYFDSNFTRCIDETLTGFSWYDARTIVENEIPVLFMFDDFDDMKGFLKRKDVEYDYDFDASVQAFTSFLHDFVDPATRAAHLHTASCPKLVRACDAMLVASSREFRIDNVHCNFDSTESTAFVDKWNLDLWNKGKIVEYCDKFFERLRRVASQPNASVVNNLPSNVDTLVSSRLQRAPSASDSATGLPQPWSERAARTVCFACECVADGSLDVVNRTSRSATREKWIRGMFHRRTGLIEKFLGRPVNEDELRKIGDNCIDHLSEQAFRCWTTRNADMEFPDFRGPDSAILARRHASSWGDISVMVDLLTIIPDRKMLRFSSNRAIVQYLCARFVAYSDTFRRRWLQKLPFGSGDLGTWRFLSEMVQGDFSCERSTPKVELSDIVSVVAKKDCWKEENISEDIKRRLQDPNDQSVCDEVKETLPLRLLVELTLVIDPAVLLPKLPSRIYFHKIAELCGEFGALKTLKWLLANFFEHEKMPKPIFEACLRRATERQENGGNNQELISFLRQHQIPSD